MLGRTALIICFILFGVLSFGIVALSILHKQWETTTAALSLLIAIISAWIAFEAFYRQDQARRPQLSLSIDTESRYSLIQLVCKNSGDMPAYNIEIKWNNPLLTNEKPPQLVRFSLSETGPEIAVLNPKEVAATYVTTDYEFYQTDEKHDLDYSGTISYQESFHSTKRTIQNFQFSLKHTRRSLAAKNEDLITMKELQKLPVKLQELVKEIQQVRKALGK